MLQTTKGTNIPVQFKNVKMRCLEPVINAHVLVKERLDPTK